MFDEFEMRLFQIWNTENNISNADMNKIFPSSSNNAIQVFPSFHLSFISSILFNVTFLKQLTFMLMRS